jgi:integrase
VSTKCTKMTDRLPRKSKRVFSIYSMDKQFYRQRKRIANKLNNPRLLSISFHTLRHFKGTTEYHKTKDILRVKYILGHKNIRNTLIYIDIENTLFQGQENDEFHIKTAGTIDEACKLLEVGFEYVCDMDEVKLFRKRK